MTARESMGRRPTVNGDELDALCHGRDLVFNHGDRAKVKTRHNRRVRRQVRQALRNSDES
jgi:hypothetical protein